MSRRNAAGSCDLVDVRVVGVLGRRVPDRFPPARVRLTVVGGDLAHRQTHPPFVAEVEEVGEPLALLEPQPVETDLRARASRSSSEGAERVRLGGVEGMGVLATVARVELAVRPERVEVVIVPVERGLQRVVDVNEGLIAADRDRAMNASKADEVGLQHVDLLGHGAPLARGTPKLRAAPDESQRSDHLVTWGAPGPRRSLGWGSPGPARTRASGHGEAYPGGYASPGWSGPASRSRHPEPITPWLSRPAATPACPVPSRARATSPPGSPHSRAPGGRS